MLAGGAPERGRARTGGPPRRGRGRHGSRRRNGRGTRQGGRVERDSRVYEERRGAFPDRPQPRDLVRAVGSRSARYGRRRLQARGGKLLEMLLCLSAPAREQIGQWESEKSAGGG